MIAAFFVFFVFCIIHELNEGLFGEFEGDPDTGKIVPQEPFASQIHEVLKTDKDFKAKWMVILGATWKTLNYMGEDLEPPGHDRRSDVRRTRAEFIRRPALDEFVTPISAHLAKKEQHGKELEARRVEVWRKLAHVHGATGPSNCEGRSSAQTASMPRPPTSPISMSRTADLFRSSPWSTRSTLTLVSALVTQNPVGDVLSFFVRV